MENLLLKSYVWLFSSCIHVLYAAGPNSSNRRPSAMCCNQTTEIKGEIALDENAETGKIVYSIDKPSGFEYNSSQPLEPESFKIIIDTLKVSIEVRLKLYLGLSESMTITFTSTDINCRSVIVFTIILTVPQITRISINVNVSICQPGVVVYVQHVTCDSRNYTTCQPQSCNFEGNDIFRVSEGTMIQAKVGNINFSHAYDLFVDCEVIFESNGRSTRGDIKLEFEVKFQDLCGSFDETLSSTHRTESTISGLIPNFPASSATVANATSTIFTWQNKSETMAPITQINSPVDGTGCNPKDSSSKGLVVGPTMVAVLATIAALIGASTAVGCYCLGYKRCVPLPVSLCHREIKDEETDEAEHNPATA